MSSCPYRKLCPHCPGDDLERGEWESSLGFQEVPEGILCLDWDIVIPQEKAVSLKKLSPEPKHIVDSVEAANKLDASQRKYNKTPKLRAAQKRYKETPKGKAAQQKYTQSEKFKLACQKYYCSDKGQVSYLGRRQLVKDFRGLARWLKNNPGKTFDDWSKEQEVEK